MTPTSDRLSQALALLDSDAPLAALALLDGAVGIEADALRARIAARTAHLASAEAYAAFYNEPAPERPWFPEEHLSRVHDAIPRWRLVRNEIIAQGARSVLELGCLDGFCLLNLAITHGIPSVGVDVNRGAIAELERRAAGGGLQVVGVTSLIEDLDLRKHFQLGHVAFDAVLCLEVLEHVRDVDAVLAVAERHLAPGGRVYLSAPLTAPKHQHEREAREHVRLLDPTTFTGLLTKPGRVPTCYLQFVTPDGLHHMGAYTVAA